MLTDPLPCLVEPPCFEETWEETCGAGTGDETMWDMVGPPTSAIKSNLETPGALFSIEFRVRIGCRVVGPATHTHDSFHLILAPMPGP